MKVERMVRMGRMECREVGRVGEGADEGRTGGEDGKDKGTGRKGQIESMGNRGMGRMKEWGACGGWEG